MNDKCGVDDRKRCPIFAIEDEAMMMMMMYDLNSAGE